MLFPWHFLGISCACSWHLLSIVVSFLSIPIYVTSFSKDSIYSKPSSSSCAGTGCLCCLLLHSRVFLIVSWHFLRIFFAFLWRFLGIFEAWPWHLLGIVVSFLSVPICVPSFSQDSIDYKASSSCFAGTGCLCCLLLLHFLSITSAFFGIFYACSWHELSIIVSFLSSLIYVPPFSEASIYFKASSSCFGGTGCLCCLLLDFHIFLSAFLIFVFGIFLAFPLHALGIFYACSAHLLGIVVSFLSIPMYVLHFLRIPYFPRLLLRV